MLDVAVSYNKYKFLGNEFLTWLWYLIENEIDIKTLITLEEASASLALGNSITLENSLGDESVEKISIRGDDAGLEEGTTALRKGAVVTDMNLLLTLEENEWRLTIKGESMHLTGVKGPAVGKVENKEDVEGAVLEKIELSLIPCRVIDMLYTCFIEKRTSDQWKDIDIPGMRAWLEQDA